MIEPYCDSDEEVFFGPITMREIKVIFHLRDTANKPEEMDRCMQERSAPDTTVAEQERSEYAHVRNGSRNGTDVETTLLAGEASPNTCSSDLLNKVVNEDDMWEHDQGMDSSGDSLRVHSVSTCSLLDEDVAALAHDGSCRRAEALAKGCLCKNADVLSQNSSCTDAEAWTHNSHEDSKVLTQDGSCEDAEALSRDLCEATEKLTQDGSCEYVEVLAKDASCKDVEALTQDGSCEYTEALAQDGLCEYAEVLAQDSSYEDAKALAQDSSCEDAKALAHDSSCEDAEVLAQDSLCEDVKALAHDSSCEDAEVLAQDSLCEGAEALAQDSSCEDAKALAQDSLCEGAEALAHDISCEEAEVDPQRGLSNCSSGDDMDDTLGKMNKLLALADDSPHTCASHEVNVDVEDTTRIPWTGFGECFSANVSTSILETDSLEHFSADVSTRVPQAGSLECFSADAYTRISQPKSLKPFSTNVLTRICQTESFEHSSAVVLVDAGLVGDIPTSDASLDNNSSARSIHTKHLDSVGVTGGSTAPMSKQDLSRVDKHNSSSGKSCLEPRNHADEPVSCDAMSDKENAGGGTSARTQEATKSGAWRAVFAAPRRCRGYTPRSATKPRRAVQSPVGIYIRSPAPFLVQNVQPTLRQGAVDAYTPDNKKAVAVTPARSPLPTVHYASKPAHVLVSEPCRAQKLPPSVKKLITTREPVITHHLGRFRVKNLAELQHDVSSSDAEVSILVQKSAASTTGLFKRNAAGTKF